MNKKKSHKSGGEVDMEDDEGPDRGVGGVTIEGLSGAGGGGEDD